MYLIPKPLKWEEKEGKYAVRYDSYIVVDKGCGERTGRQAQLFQKELEKRLGFAPAVTRGCARKQDIHLMQDDSFKKEEYRLEIKEDGVILTGSESGIWYGMQTLLQMVSQAGALLPACVIEDSPVIENRGFYHDITRGRIPTLAYLKKMADRMAYYKLNQLQLYIEHSFLFRDVSELWRDSTPLLPEEIMELDDYCAERGIELVPSLSSFGHLYHLLSSKKYSHLCELENSEKQPFSLVGRMKHHTIDVTNPESLQVVKELISEFLPLFRSSQFNICADETFDLGKGKSREAAERLTVDRIYIDYVKELCNFLVEKGKRPMFWGDVICGFPEMIKELPEQTICLNWGYAADVTEDSSRSLAEAGAVQYSCPGVAGWNRFVNNIRTSYENITRMCSYAMKYHSIGLLNTDWGDYGHMNHPEFSLPGMIYGAAFSWNPQIIPFEEINRQISVLAYGDDTEHMMELMTAISEQTVFSWDMAVRFREMAYVEEDYAESDEYLRKNLEEFAKAPQKNETLEALKKELCALSVKLGEEGKKDVRALLVSADGMQIFNEFGQLVASRFYKQPSAVCPDAWKLAEKLENWLYHFKEEWRKVSRESELYRIQDVVIWMADYAREK